MDPEPDERYVGGAGGGGRGVSHACSGTGPLLQGSPLCVCPGRYDWYEHSFMPLTVTRLFDPNLSLLFLF